MTRPQRFSSTDGLLRQSNICGTNNTMYNVEPNNTPKIFALRDERMSMLLASDDQEFNSTIQVSSFFAWTVLCLNSLFAAFVPCWLMGDLQSEPFTRNSWRYTTVSVLLIPFVLYQQRNIKYESQKFQNCLTKSNLKPIFILSINYCIWLLLLIQACNWTSMNHAVCLSDMKILVISLLKFKNGEKFHEFEVGGAMIAVLGVFLVLFDSVMLPIATEEEAGVNRYLMVQPWKRLALGDGLAVLGSFASYYLDRFYVRPEMPRFTYLFLYHVFLTFNLITFGYFFGGSQFSFNTKFGVFGLYTYTNFAPVFYVSIMLGMTLIMTNILVRQIFSELIINIAARFEIVETSVMYHMIGLELVPSGLTCLGYAFLVPGLVFILGGQASLENQDNRINFELYRPVTARDHQISKAKTVDIASGKKNMPFLEILEQQQKQ